jgi:hypothetical protein
MLGCAARQLLPDHPEVWLFDPMRVFSLCPVKGPGVTYHAGKPLSHATNAAVWRHRPWWVNAKPIFRVFCGIGGQDKPG